MESKMYSRDLGYLTEYEVYDYLDGPLFMCYQNELGHLFLSRIVKRDFDSEKWLFLPVSQIRFFTVRSGGINVKEAFKQSETGYCYLVEIPMNEHPIKELEKLVAADIPDAYLPPSDFMMNLPTQTLPLLSDSIQARSIQSKRVLLNFHLNYPNNLRTEAPIDNFGKILISTQEVMNALGQAKRERATKRGYIPRDITARNSFLLSELGGGSFEFELASEEFVNLLDESELTDSVDELAQLIQIGTDADKLKDRLSTLKIRVASKYHDFLESIAEKSTSTIVKWASPVQGKSGEARISKLHAQIAAESIAKISEETIKEFEIIGQLVGANSDQKTFEIKSGNEKYSGKVEQSQINILSGAVIDETYKALIRKKDTIKVMTGDETTEYLLIGINKVSLDFDIASNDN